MFKQPPTPPIEDDFETIACDIGLELLQPSVYRTPDDSPSTESMGKTPRESNSKRVGFILLPKAGAKTARGTKKLEESKPRRSILKQSTFSSDPVSSDTIEPPDHKSSPEMLEQMIKGLASDNVSARYDAYMSINGCLKTYKDLPTERSLAEKMSVLDGYLRRDLAMECSNGNHRESQMVSEALRFTTQLCRLSETRSVVTAAFQTFLLNRAITVLSNKDTSKVLANLYLYFLSTQEFPPRVMNKEKVVRILAVLKDRAAKTQGIQATTHRLAIYTKLVGQARDVMAAGAHSWVRDLLNNLVSQTKDIRERAISFGILAGTTYGLRTDKTVAEAVERDMNTTITMGEQKTTYIHAMIERLRPWAGSRQDALDLTSVWSIIILLLRSKSDFPSKWQPLQQWLELLNECFRYNDAEIRSKGNLAWTRFIATISPAKTTSASISSLLFRPVFAQLQSHQQHQKAYSGLLKNYTLEVYLTLLYYGFRPGSDFATFDRYWKEYIASIYTGRKGLLLHETLACRILTALFANPHQVWQSDRALDTSNPLKIEDIPRLDCKWVRSRADIIVNVLQKYLPNLNADDSSRNDTWKVVWKAFLDSIKLAGTKEVKVSPETMQVMVLLVQTFRQLVSYEKYLCAAWLMSYAHSLLGDLPFLEERIRQTKDSNGFEVISVSTDRTKQSDNQPTSALRLVIASAIGVFDDEKWAAIEKEPILKSLEFPLIFLETTKLMRAGFKTLPVEVRYSPTGTMQMKILDGMQQAASKPGSITVRSIQQLLYFTRWLDKCLSGDSPPPVDDSTIETTVDVMAVDEDTIVVANQKPASKSARTTKNKGKAPLIPVSAPVTPEVALERRRTTTLQQQPRMRHDNSQIEFAAIDSSPSILQAIESQMLTERQKEVKERQAVEGNALFPDISSSSGPKARTDSTPRLQLRFQERPGSSSPILPPTESMAANRNCSESPSMRKTSSGNAGDSMTHPSSSGMVHFSLDDPPSSPPAEALEAVQNENRTTSCDADMMEPISIEAKDEDQHIAADFVTVEEAPILSHFLASAPVTISEADVLVSLEVEEPTAEQQAEDAGPDAEDVDIVDVIHYTPEEEDDELINSQIDQDIRRASQDAIVAESPRRQTQKHISKQHLEVPIENPKEHKKRLLPVEGDNEHQSKRIRSESSENPAAAEAALPTDLVTNLEMVLQQARFGMGTQESLAVLRMAAELTQLAVKAVQQ